MSRIDETRTFLPVNIAVLTVSDTRALDDDKSGREFVEPPLIPATICFVPRGGSLLDADRRSRFNAGVDNKLN